MTGHDLLTHLLAAIAGGMGGIGALAAWLRSNLHVADDPPGYRVWLGSTPIGPLRATRQRAEQDLETTRNLRVWQRDRDRRWL